MTTKNTKVSQTSLDLFNENKYRSEIGMLDDDDNSNFLLSQAFTHLVVKIANGSINMQYLAKIELAARGKDLNGEWIGFAKAKELYGIK